jgi:hypothetical protein
MKKLIYYTVIFLAGFALGLIWFKFRIFPIPQIDHYKTHIMPVVVYSKNEPIFHDRNYLNTDFDKRLEGLHLIKLNRHRDYRDLIILDIKVPITLYRIISTANENNFLHTYEDTNIKVNIAGPSSTHTKVIKKSFLQGTIKLSAGKGLSSSPILISPTIDDLSRKKVFTFVADFNCKHVQD